MQFRPRAICRPLSAISIVRCCPLNISNAYQVCSQLVHIKAVAFSTSAVVVISELVSHGYHVSPMIVSINVHSKIQV